MQVVLIKEMSLIFNRLLCVSRVLRRSRPTSTCVCTLESLESCDPRYRDSVEYSVRLRWHVALWWDSYSLLPRVVQSRRLMSLYSRHGPNAFIRYSFCPRQRRHTDSHWLMYAIMRWNVTVFFRLRLDLLCPIHTAYADAT